MSGIFGIFNRDGSPVVPRAMDAMARAMDGWGPDGCTKRIEKAVGLGHLMLRTTPESLYETQPLTSPCGNFTLISHARIDNRKELFDRLEIPPSLRATMPDNELIMRSWEKWGKDCPEYLIGDWVFALFDSQKQQLFLAKDHLGVSGLYYYLTEKQILFASSLKGLFALSWVPRELNSLYLGRFLTLSPQTPGEIVYKDINRLIPAHWLRITPDRVTTKRYWILEDTPKTRFSRDEEYVEAFMALYTEAVKVRLRSIKPVGANLSGGLDSGSVAALAAKELGAQGKSLDTFSAVPRYDVSHITSFPNRFPDERPYIEATVGFNGCMTPHFIKADTMGPVAGIRKWLDITMVPAHAAGNLYWILAILEDARKKNIGVMLCGQRGNATISWRGRKRPSSKFHSLIRLIRNEQNPLPLISKKTATYLLKKVQGRSGRQSLQNEFPALNLDFLNSLGKAVHILPPSRRGLEQIALIRPQEGYIGAMQYETGAWAGIERRDPTADKRVVGYCFSLPDEQFNQNGTHRRLIRRAMAGVLPEKVRLNTRLGLQSADLETRLVNDPDLIPTLEALYKSPSLKRVCRIDTIRKLHEKKERSLCETSALTKSIITGMFLQSLES